MADTQSIGRETWEALAGSWHSSGVGWNIIAVPTRITDDAPAGFTLLIAQLTETLRFTAVPGDVRNRQARGDEHDMSIKALRYAQDIADASGTGIHAESGMWLLLDEAGTIARQGSVPHGDAFLALGQVTRSEGGPQIPDNTARPDMTGTPDEVLATLMPQYDKLSAGGVVPEALDIDNPNATLRAAIGERKILSTTTLSVDSTTDTAGVLNIPFITRNANATRVVATLWLMTVDEGEGKTSQLLAYSQQVDVRFKSRFDYGAELIVWPHITFNVLERLAG